MSSNTVIRQQFFSACQEQPNSYICTNGQINANGILLIIVFSVFVGLLTKIYYQYQQDISTFLKYLLHLLLGKEIKERLVNPGTSLQKEKNNMTVILLAPFILIAAVLYLALLGEKPVITILVTSFYLWYRHKTVFSNISKK